MDPVDVFYRQPSLLPIFDSFVVVQPQLVDHKPSRRTESNQLVIPHLEVLTVIDYAWIQEVIPHAFGIDWASFPFEAVAGDTRIEKVGRLAFKTRVRVLGEEMLYGKMVLTSQLTLPNPTESAGMVKVPAKRLLELLIVCDLSAIGQFDCATPTTKPRVMCVFS